MNEIKEQGYVDPKLIELGLESYSLSAEQIRQLDEQGYVVFENVIDAEWLRVLRKTFDTVYEAEGEEAGVEVAQMEGVRRLADLVNKGEGYRSAKCARWTISYGQLHVDARRFYTDQWPYAHCSRHTFKTRARARLYGRSQSGSSRSDSFNWESGFGRCF